MKTCPECKQNKLVESIFGSICGNCFYNPNKPKRIEHATVDTVCGDCWFEQFEIDYYGNKYHAVRHSPMCPQFNIRK